MISLPPGLTTWTVARSLCVTRKRIRSRSKRQSSFGVKAGGTGGLDPRSVKSLGETRVTRSSTSGSRLTRWDQAKAASVAKTRRAKTRPAQALAFGRGIVLADDHRYLGVAGDRGYVCAHQPHLRDSQRSGDAMRLGGVAALEHDDAFSEAGAAVGHRAELESLALDLVAVLCREPRHGGAVEHRHFDFARLQHGAGLAMAALAVGVVGALRHKVGGTHGDGDHDDEGHRQVARFGQARAEVG